MHMLSDTANQFELKASPIWAANQELFTYRNFFLL